MFLEDEHDDPTRQNGVFRPIVGANCPDQIKFPSYWEMDEADVDEATEEEIQNNPVTRMLWAAETGNQSVMEELFRATPELVNCKDNDGYTPLHRAAYNAHAPAIKFLLDHGADLRARTNDGWTALHSACNWGNAEEASILLSHGAEINALTSGQQTPLHLAACNSDSKETLELLLTHPLIDYSVRNAVGETARDLAERTTKYCYLFEITDDSINKLT